MKKITAFIITLLFAGTVSTAQKRPDPQPAPETKESFHIGMAGYTFVKFDLDKAIATMKKADVHYLCIKDFHLPLKSTDEQIKNIQRKTERKWHYWLCCRSNLHENQGRG